MEDDLSTLMMTGQRQVKKYMYLTTSEYAELTRYPLRTVQSKCKGGSIKSNIQLYHNRPVYMIPISELSEKEQLRYYRQNNILMPQEEKPQKVESQNPTKPMEMYTETERQKIALWINILKDWQCYLAVTDDCRAVANSNYVDKLRIDYPNIKVSVDILYRKNRAYKANNLDGLIDRRGKAKTGCSKIDENLWQCYLYYYLDQAQHPQRACYDYTAEWAAQYHPELLPMPAYTTFARHIKSDLADPVKTLGRCGEKAYKDKYGLYIRRVYDNMQSNDYWIADNHTFDVMVGEKPHRLYLTAFMDARSGIFTGCYVTSAPSSQATLIALRKGILQYGIPKNIYVDNGREFLTFDVGGLGHRAKKSKKDKFTPPPIFERLGIKMTNAIVRNAKAKIIERRFLDVKNRLSRLFESYTGGSVSEKPEQLKQVLKQGNIVDDAEFTKIVNEVLEYCFNYDIYNGSVSKDKGKRKIDIYNEYLIEKREAAEEDLNLMLMRSSRAVKVSRRGVTLNISGKKLDYYNDELLMNWQGKQVYYRYDPENLGSVRVYDLDNRYITTADCGNKTVAEYGSNKEKISDAMREIRRQEKMVKEALKSNTVVALGAESALDIVLAQAARNEKIAVEVNSKVVSIRRADEEQLQQVVGYNTNNTIDISRMIRNAEKRKDEI